MSIKAQIGANGARAGKATEDDPLALYNEKRDFTRTSEPSGTRKRGKSKTLSFVVQKHDARRLHWDFRLELNGTLKSWAVTRGPSLDPADKRLAVRTEDHPLSYGTFEGTIPKGEYGGGTVMVWDRGTWAPIVGKSADTLDEGHLHFTLEGERMKGEWILIRLPRKPGERQENWLLKKVDDDHAGDGEALIGRHVTSVTTGRTMEEIAVGAAPIQRPKKQRHSSKRVEILSLPTPPFQPPQLAMPSGRLPAGDDWLFEIKYDGYRGLIATGKDGSFGWTRSGLDWTDKFAPIVEATKKLCAGSLLIDGEIVALNEEGKPDFSSLQSALKREGDALLFFAFDLLHLNGDDLSAMPLIERKARLIDLLEGVDAPLHYAEHIESDGTSLFNAMAANGYEGVIAKRGSQPYVGHRSEDWLKIKVDRREEFVIVGTVPSDKKGRAFSSLLLAQYEREKLIYRGRVGTGFDDATAADIVERLKPVAKAPVVNPELAASSGKAYRRATAKPVWAKPRLVAEIRFAEYTTDKVLRHASFMGLRDDKPVSEVVSEMAQKKTVKGEVLSWTAPEPSIEISSANREIFGDGGPTKGDLASWYEAISAFALQWIADRPLSLLRCPSGIGGQCFFQKHIKEGWGNAVGAVRIDGKDGKNEPTFLVHDKVGLLQCVQMGTVEFHGWGALAGDVEHPDRLVFDLDPDEGLNFSEVKHAAQLIHDHLADMGLVTFPMLTGGKGIHVIAPLNPIAGWEEVEGFAKKFAGALEQTDPNRYTQSMSKARRKGKIFVDWMRNRRGSTAILPWSVRARDGAPIAVPISWEQMLGLKSAHTFTLGNPDVAFTLAQNLEASWGHADQSLPGS